MQKRKNVNGWKKSVKYVDKEDSSWDRMWKSDRNLLINTTGSYFLVGPEFLQKVEFRIFGAWTVCIIRNMIIHRRPF